MNKYHIKILEYLLKNDDVEWCFFNRRFVLESRLEKEEKLKLKKLQKTLIELTGCEYIGNDKGQLYLKEQGRNFLQKHKKSIMKNGYFWTCIKNRKKLSLGILGTIGFIGHCLLQNLVDLFTKFN